MCYSAVPPPEPSGTTTPLWVGYPCGRHADTATIVVAAPCPRRPHIHIMSQLQTHEHPLLSSPGAPCKTPKQQPCYALLAALRSCSAAKTHHKPSKQTTVSCMPLVMHPCRSNLLQPCICFHVCCASHECPSCTPESTNTQHLFTCSPPMAALALQVRHQPAPTATAPAAAAPPNTRRKPSR